jgi:tetratricopeptide (TPR) repeat protein
LLGILAAGVLLFKKYRLISFGIFWFFLTISVESSIIPISQNVIFEHRTYLPGFGFFLALTGAFFYCFKEKYLKFAVIILLMIAALNTVLTYQRNKVWKNEYTLWSDCLKKSPDKARVHANLCLAYKDLGNYRQAIDECDRAIDITPRYKEAYINRGLAYNNLGNYRQAIEDYGRAIEINPRFLIANYNRGIAYYGLGNYKQAIEDLDRMIEINPGYAEAYINRGNSYNGLGNHKQAIEDYGRAIEINPRLAEAYLNRGVTYSMIGNEKLTSEDLKTAAILGNEHAKNLLKRQGISW